MRDIALFLIFITFTACSQEPQPINYGKDACIACKMTIIDKKYGAEIITTKGKIYKFDDLICMINFISSGAVSENEISHKLIIDFQKENNFVNAEQAAFYVSEALHSPMNGNAAAFINQKEAEIYQHEKQGVIMDWTGVYNKLK